MKIRPAEVAASDDSMIEDVKPGASMALVERAKQKVVIVSRAKQRNALKRSEGTPSSLFFASAPTRWSIHSSQVSCLLSPLPQRTLFLTRLCMPRIARQENSSWSTSPRSFASLCVRKSKDDFSTARLWYRKLSLSQRAAELYMSW